MKFSRLILTALLILNSSLSLAAQTFCGLSITEAWPEVVSETSSYFTKYIQSKESDREALEKEFEKIASQSIKQNTPEDAQAIKQWTETLREMLSFRNNPLFTKLITRAAMKALSLSSPGSIKRAIKTQLNSRDPEIALQLGLSIDEELESIIVDSKNSDIRDTLEKWRENYPETLGVFIVSNLLELKSSQSNLDKAKTIIRVSINKLVEYASNLLRRKKTKSLSDARFERILKVGPQAEKRLRLITAVQVGLVVGSAAAFLELGDSVKYYNFILQVFSPFLGARATAWAFDGAQVDAKKKNVNTWAMRAFVVLTQLTMGVFPDVQFATALITGPASGGVIFGRVLSGRAYSVTPESAADAVVGSSLFDRLSLTQLQRLLPLVSQAKKPAVEQQLAAVSKIK
ncbi:MAG: hypothetical protein KA715_11235 [Xanthomonadaceae bacterium]|nr:hypothetical protein [Xanthomonadaceae bacterium]